MFQVEWPASIVDIVTQFWLDADSATRRAITVAVAEVDRLLSRDPLDVGESREGDNRILFVEPLAVTYRVEARLNQVTILHVRIFRRRK